MRIALCESGALGGVPAPVTRLALQLAGLSLKAQP